MTKTERQISCPFPSSKTKVGVYWNPYSWESASPAGSWTFNRMTFNLPANSLSIPSTTGFTVMQPSQNGLWNSSRIGCPRPICERIAEISRSVLVPGPSKA